jgi:hypothetical protein
MQSFKIFVTKCFTVQTSGSEPFSRAALRARPIQLSHQDEAARSVLTVLNAID